MKNHLLYSLTLLLLTVWACDDNESYDRSLERSLDLSNLSEGQISHFIRYSSNCSDFNANLTYTGDTLILSVIERNDSIFLVEKLTPSSASILPNIKLRSIEYNVGQIDNSLLIRDRFSSYLLYFYGNDSLRLTPDIRIPMRQENCLIMMNEEPFIGNDIGSIEHFRVGSNDTGEKTVVSCVPDFQIDGYLIYDQNELIISHTVSGESVQGWIIL